MRSTQNWNKKYMWEGNSITSINIQRRYLLWLRKRFFPLFQLSVMEHTLPTSCNAHFFRFGVDHHSRIHYDHCNAYYSNQGAVRECISDSVMNINSAKQGHREHDHLSKKERAQLKKARREGKYECTYSSFQYFHIWMYVQTTATFAFNNIYYNTFDWAP